MRLILRIIMTLVAIVAFFSMAIFGVFYAYGQYGAPLVVTELEKAEDQIEQDIEDNYPGADVTVDFDEVFYNFGEGSYYVAFKVHSVAELGGIEVENTIQYAVVDVLSALTGNPQYETYEESEWPAVSEGYKPAPEIIFDGTAAKKMATTYLIISGVVFVASIVVKHTVLRKKIA